MFLMPNVFLLERALEKKRNNDILNLYLHAENTQERIAEMYPDLTHQTVSNIIERFAKNGKDAEISKDDLFPL